MALTVAAPPPPVGHAASSAAGWPCCLAWRAYPSPNKEKKTGFELNNPTEIEDAVSHLVGFWFSFHGCWASWVVGKQCKSIVKQWQFKLKRLWSFKSKTLWFCWICYWRLSMCGHTIQVFFFFKAPNLWATVWLNGCRSNNRNQGPENDATRTDGCTLYKKFHLIAWRKSRCVEWVELELCVKVRLNLSHHVLQHNDGQEGDLVLKYFSKWY